MSNFFSIALFLKILSKYWGIIRPAVSLRSGGKPSLGYAHGIVVNMGVPSVT